jgi:hypothetical protein
MAVTSAATTSVPQSTVMRLCLQDELLARPDSCHILVGILSLLNLENTIFAFPVLQRADVSIIIKENAKLTSLLLNVLTFVTSTFIVQDHRELTEIAASSLTYVGGDFVIKYNKKLLTLPSKLFNVSTAVEIRGCPLITIVAMDRLRSSGLYIKENIVLTRVVFAALTHSVDIAIEANPLLQLIAINMLSIVAQNLIINGNEKLDEVKATSLSVIRAGQLHITRNPMFIDGTGFNALTYVHSGFLLCANHATFIFPRANFLTTGVLGIKQCLITDEQCSGDFAPCP